MIQKYNGILTEVKGIGNLGTLHQNLFGN